MTELLRWAEWHYGDRVIHLTTLQYGIVYGWKLDQLLIHWGTQDRRPVWTWEPKHNVELVSHE